MGFNNVSCSLVLYLSLHCMQIKILQVNTIGLFRLRVCVRQGRSSIALPRLITHTLEGLPIVVSMYWRFFVNPIPAGFFEMIRSRGCPLEGQPLKSLSHLSFQQDEYHLLQILTEKRPALWLAINLPRGKELTGTGSRINRSA